MDPVSAALPQNLRRIFVATLLWNNTIYTMLYTGQGSYYKQPFDLHLKQDHNSAQLGVKFVFLIHSMF